MATASKVTVLWSGFPGAPGYSNFVTNAVTVADVNDFVTKLRSFLSAVAGQMSAVCTLAVQPTAIVFDVDLGIQLSELVITPGAPIVGGALNNQFAAPSGACVTWHTGYMRLGKHFRGRTFLVPLSTSAYQNDGTILDTVATSLRTAITNFANPGAATASDLQVYGRPMGISLKHPLGDTGRLSQVLSGALADKVAMLRSRRQ